MELKEIYGLWDRFESSSATKLELDYQGTHLKLEKGNDGVVMQPVVSTPVAAGANGCEALSVKENTVATDQKRDVSEAEIKELKAPLVGIFYRAAAPGEKPYVEAGQKIAKGDIIGIIEAMKVMNEITAKEDGIVEEILAEDAALVEYNQTLLTFR
ncbi:MAG: acetyl-CoA carboxylase biotin carboxyl carrier protein [Eubacteriales bacterium]|nr:acetyl-CoA carboxylase biotin carboxyl carrier protein [Eubacteriales bacterium]